MIRIAIVEDEACFCRTLTDFLHRYEAEKHLCFRIRAFGSGEDFLSNNTEKFDLAFMDIQLPGINGMETARILRRMDEQVTLIFISTLTQYAITGYEVGALFYLLKPLRYHDFALKITVALQRIPQTDNLLLRSGTEMLRIRLRDIRYLESAGHNVIYHTGSQSISRRCSLRQAEAELDQRFVRCSSSFIVNMDHIRAISGDTVDIGGQLLRISRPQRQTFLLAVTKHQEDSNV